MDRAGLGDRCAASHIFFSTPILLNSSELMFETSISAPERARSKSKLITVTIVDMCNSFLDLIYKRIKSQKVASPNGTVMSQF